MNYPAYYEADVLRYFSANPMEQAFYEVLVRQMDACMPEVSVKVQKSQISFYDRHLFGRGVHSAAAQEGLAENMSFGDVRPFPSGGGSPDCRGGGAVSQPLDPSCADLRVRAD